MSGIKAYSIQADRIPDGSGRDFIELTVVHGEKVPDSCMDYTSGISGPKAI